MPFLVGSLAFGSAALPLETYSSQYDAGKKIGGGNALLLRKTDETAEPASRSWFWWGGAGNLEAMHD